MAARQSQQEVLPGVREQCSGLSQKEKKKKNRAMYATFCSSVEERGQENKRNLTERGHRTYRIKQQIISKDKTQKLKEEGGRCSPPQNKHNHCSHQEGVSSLVAGLVTLLLLFSGISFFSQYTV